MHVFGHNNISNDLESIPAAHTLHNLFKDVASRICFKVLQPTVTGEGDVVQLPCLLIAFQS